MDPIELLSRVTVMQWNLADSAARSLANPLAGLEVMAGEADPALQGRLLEPLTEFPGQHPLLRFVRELVGDPALPTALVRAHGWKHAAAVDADRGVALVLAEGTSRAVFAAGALTEFLGAGRSAATQQTQLLLKASREHGLRFADAGVRVDLPIGLNLPGVSARGFAVELCAGDSGLALTPTLSLFAKPPALPSSADMSGQTVAPEGPSPTETGACSVQTIVPNYWLPLVPLAVSQSRSGSTWSRCCSRASTPRPSASCCGSPRTKPRGYGCTSKSCHATAHFSPVALSSRGGSTAPGTPGCGGRRTPAGARAPAA